MPNELIKTQIIDTGFDDNLTDAVTQAVDRLRAGEVVALPTETVYGLAADALNAHAVAKIFEVKERPHIDPLIVHLPGKRKSALEEVAILPSDQSEEGEAVRKLMDAFWPGPLTILLPKTPAVPDLVTAGLPTVAVRQSADPVFKRIINEFGGPLAAPSANRYGRISPTSAAAVEAELGGRIGLIINGGASKEGIESTIIRVEANERNPKKPIIHVLRPGPVTLEDLKKFGKPILAAPCPTGEEKPQAPGQLSSHYAPRKPLHLLTTPEEFHPREGTRYALLSYRGLAKDGFVELDGIDEIVILSPGSGKLPEAAVRFFFLLRRLDEMEHIDEIIAEPIPERGLGIALMDRLRRAAHKG